VLCDRPRILFVGINPSLTSARVGHHFAGPGNPFWRLLHAAGIVPEPLGAHDDGRLPEWALALTNACPRGTRSARELTAAELRRGCEDLRRKIERARPAVVAFVGVSLYQRFSGRQATAGPGAKPDRIAGARVFVVPNPSGLNAAFPGFRDKLVWYRRLARFAGEPPRGAPGSTPPRRRPRRRRSSAASTARACSRVDR
jgi:TDG/mug DNA glycosylase family protein